MIHPITKQTIPDGIAIGPNTRFAKPGRPKGYRLYPPTNFNHIPVVKKSDAILRFIKQYLTEYALFPTVREITEGLNISSTSVTDYHLQILVEDGKLEQIKKGSARAYRIPGMKVVFE